MPWDILRHTPVSGSGGYKTFHPHPYGFRVLVIRLHWQKITSALYTPRLTMSEANPPDTERGESLASYGPGIYHVRARQPPQSRQFIFAIQPLNGASQLIDVTLQETARGGLIFYHARTSIARAAAERWYKKCLTKIFTKCSVGTAKVHQVGTGPSVVCSVRDSD